MKIGALDSQPVPTSSGSERRPSPPRAGSAAEPSARVELSSQAALLDGGSAADFDAAKVERIAQSIRDGSFRVDPEAIADKLIANAQELLARPSGN